jgi:hypothetical protein
MYSSKDEINNDERFIVIRWNDVSDVLDVVINILLQLLRCKWMLYWHSNKNVIKTHIHYSRNENPIKREHFKECDKMWSW